MALLSRLPLCRPLNKDEATAFVSKPDPDHATYPFAARGSKTRAATGKAGPDDDRRQSSADGGKEKARKEKGKRPRHAENLKKYSRKRIPMALKRLMR